MQERALYTRWELNASHLKHDDKPDELLLLHQTHVQLPAIAQAWINHMPTKTRTQAHQLKPYKHCRLIGGVRIKTFFTQREGNDPRCTAYVSYQEQHQRTLLFGTVEYFVKDPADMSSWACVRTWSDVSPPRAGLPRCVRNQRGPFHCVPIHSIKAPIGLVTVHTVRGGRTHYDQYVVDKDGTVEKTQQPCLCIDPFLTIETL